MLYLYNFLRTKVVFFIVYLMIFVLLSFFVIKLFLSINLINKLNLESVFLFLAFYINLFFISSIFKDFHFKELMKIGSEFFIRNFVLFIFSILLYLALWYSYIYIFALVFMAAMIFNINLNLFALMALNFFIYFLFERFFVGKEIVEIYAYFYYFILICITIALKEYFISVYKQNILEKI